MAARTPAPRAPRAPRTAWVALALFVVLGTIYTCNFRLRGAGDSIPTRLLPFSVLREGDLDLDEFTFERGPSGRLPYYVHPRDGHLWSVSTIATALVVTPLYVVPAAWLASTGIDYDDVRARVVIVAMERLAAATLTALSAVLLFIVLRRLTTWRWALALALIYALGTSTWSIASQALWPHALAQLTLTALTLLLLPPRPSAAALLGAGAVLAVAVANRPQMAIFAAVAVTYVFVSQRWRVWLVIALPAAAGVALLAYNLSLFSSITGGYGGFNHFSAAVHTGLAGLLVSPNRGLLVFTPIMAFALWGAVRVWRVEAPPWLRWLTVGLALHVLLHASFVEWWAGYTYGPRYFTDVLPILTLLLVYGLVPWCHGRARRAGVAALALYGVVVQALGVYAADDSWNREPAPLERAPWRVWDWHDLQIVRAARRGLRPTELLPVMLDAFRDEPPARIARLAPEQLASAMRPLSLPATMAPGERREVALELVNRGDRTWPAFNGEGVISARHLTFLLVRWFAGGAPVPGAGDVVRLPVNGAPGEALTVRWELVAPERAGDYELELRVTQAIDGSRGVVGADALRVPLRVTRAAAASARDSS